MSAAGLALRPGQVPLKLGQVRNQRKAQFTQWACFWGTFATWGVFLMSSIQRRGQRAVHGRVGTIKECCLVDSFSCSCAANTTTCLA
jgi:hypothetical protein